MLSKTQRRFLQDSSSFSKRHSRQYRYTIRKKVFRSLDDLNLVITNNGMVGLDVQELKARLESLVALFDSVVVAETKKSSHAETKANPFLASNSGWG